MTWAKVDDQLHGHPKTSEAGVAAMGLWVLALSHCAAYLTDGLVTRRAAVKLAGSEENAERWASDLVRAKLWSVDAEGWQFHEYLQHQPSAKKVKAERKDAAKRKQMSRRDMAVTPRDVTPRSRLGHSPPSRPVPTRPKKSSLAPSDAEPSHAAGDLFDDPDSLMSEPERGTPEGDVYATLVEDPELCAICADPGDLANRIADPDAFPAIDTVAEVKRAAAWLAANPKNKKKNGARFLLSWLGRAQEKAPRVVHVDGSTSPRSRPELQVLNSRRAAS